MTRVSPDDLKAFGREIKRVRTLEGWTLDTAGGKVDPPVGKSFMSKIEKGRRESLDARTVGRLIKAFGLKEDWIDVFLDADQVDDTQETATERDADLIIDRARREGVTQGASEDLLVLLANTHAGGKYRDRETAYIGVRNALEAYAELKAQGAAGGNADAQFNAVMSKVAQLNELGEVDEADALLEEEEKRMLAEQERLEESTGNFTTLAYNRTDCATIPQQRQIGSSAA